MWTPKNPPHPGETLKFFLADLEMTQAELAERIGCKPAKVNEIVNGKRGITAEMALSLAKALGTTPIMWLNAQVSWDLAEAMRKQGKAV
jgi:addiction module HigA family antidote